MSRSTKKTPISGITTAKSEKLDKRLAHHRLRMAVRTALTSSTAGDTLPDLREVSDVWGMSKDGKRWFDASAHPEIMRK